MMPQIEEKEDQIEENTEIISKRPELIHEQNYDGESIIVKIQNVNERDQIAKQLYEMYVKHEFFCIPKPTLVPLPGFAAIGEKRKHTYPRVLQISCGAMHTLLRADNGHLYGFGDNSSGQIAYDQSSNMFVINKAINVKIVSKLHGMIYKINTGDRISYITYQNTGLETRKFFAWGDKSIIHRVSQTAMIKGGKVIPELGVHGRGGAYFEDGLWIADQYLNGSQPIVMYSAYENVAML